ncbi:hypothetical protein JXO59_01305 [candidate division KSB1 bacterium]|nr:hypothetical protein [candidate division KSB1 bacterium]
MKKFLLVAWMIPLFCFAVTPALDNSEPTATLTIYYSNDIIGYLTPCG